MPPLLAAFFLLELACDLRIIQAIDLNQEWRAYATSGTKRYYDKHALCWYQGILGDTANTEGRTFVSGTFLWPANYSLLNPKYYSQRTLN